MTKIIFCLLILTLLIANNLVESRIAETKDFGTELTTCEANEECILHNRCDEVNKMTIKKELTPKERTYLRKKLCRYINHEYHFCCAKKDERKIVLPEPPVCGLYFSDRIFSDSEDTYIDQYPWTAMIIYSKPGNKIESHCGGSLISERHVLTAAHCEVKIPKTWKISKVRLGEWNRSTNPDCMEFINEEICNEPYVDVPVRKVIVHPYYKKDAFGNQFNDIALLELDEVVKFNLWIKPICLPSDSRFKGMNFTEHSMEVSGFKLTTANEDSSVSKKVFYLNVVAQDKCRALYKGKKIYVTNKQICAGIEKRKEFCNADSGGSLMKEGNFPNSKFAHYQLIGIQSFGPDNCATKENPGVYTLVSQYVDWIKDNLN